MNVIEYFSMRQWDYQVDNITGLWQNLTKKDKEIFFFDMRQLDWDLFLQHYFRGVRQYLLNDPLDTIPEALVRWNRFVFFTIISIECSENVLIFTFLYVFRLYWVHQGVKAIVFMLFLRLAWWIASFFI